MGCVRVRNTIRRAHLCAVASLDGSTSPKQAQARVLCSSVGHKPGARGSILMLLLFTAASYRHVAWNMHIIPAVCLLPC